MAKQLAKALGYVYVDTGAMYRAVTLFAMQNGFITGESEHFQDLVSQLSTIDLKFVFNENLGFSEMYLNGKNVEREIRTLAVSKNVSRIAEIEQVRMKLVYLQQQMGSGKGIVMDGRDIGTVVFPDAELKIFMTASPEIRAKRRYEELEKKGVHVNYQEVLHNIRERDHIDSTRIESPLAKAEDAITLDNSAMSKDEQARLSLSWARGVIKSLATH